MGTILKVGVILIQPYIIRVPKNFSFPDLKAQDEKFSLIFTLASFMNNFMTFPTGYIFDRFKTAVARLLAM